MRWCMALLFTPLLGCQAIGQPEPVVDPSSLLRTEIGNLANTDAKRSIVPVSGQPFGEALRVVIGKASAETNATQLTINNERPVNKGDVILASLYLRGRSVAGRPARIEFLFEKNSAPWTKSTTQAFQAPVDPAAWRKVAVAFTAAESYAPSQAMISLRLAFGPQTVEIGGLSVLNYKATKPLDEVQSMATAQTPIGDVQVKIDPRKTLQTMEGLGGNFCQPRYGQTEPMDAVGERILKDLNVSLGRVGLPLNHWAPQQGRFAEPGQARASFLALQRLAKLKVPLIASVWEGPAWLVGGSPEQSGKQLPRDRYQTCVDLIGAYLVRARDGYGVQVDYFSFNEPDLGINFKFSPTEMAEFIKVTGDTLKRLGLTTK